MGHDALEDPSTTHRRECRFLLRRIVK
jgi:hypothetical protein